MKFLIVSLSALVVSALTLFSGFGLGTLLMPVFALFFPVEVAVTATALVHVSNNVFKIILVGRSAEGSLVIRFGAPAILAAFVGAAALGYVSHLGEIVRYTVGTRTAIITPVKLAMGSLILVFSLFELLPRLRGVTFERRYLLWGGLLSGFFGGFSGHQGALRSAFLAKVGVSTEAFVGTNAVIGFMVDAARIGTYAVMFLPARSASPLGRDDLPLVITGILSAFLGVVTGRRLIRKVTMEAVRTLTGVMLLGIALALVAGIV